MQKVTFSVIVFFAVYLTANFNGFAQVVGPIIGYGGLCESSAAVSLVDNMFIVANDEDNILRIFDASIRRPVQTFNLFDIFKPEIKDKPKMDLEGAAWLGNRIFWIGSHSQKSDAADAPDRRALFAVEVILTSSGEFNLVRSGQIYKTLIADLKKDPQFAKFDLQNAEKIAPKKIGGLSIEGLAATPEGNLLIGFRNPLIDGEIAADTSLIKGKAPIVRLLNPVGVIVNKEDAKFGAPIFLDLDGLGIRSLEYDNNRKKYLIVAGPYFSNDELPGTAKALETKIYLWSGVSGEKPDLLNVNLSGLNIEAAFFYPRSKSMSPQLISDDGKKKCDDNFRSVQLDF